MFDGFTPKKASWQRQTLFFGSIIFHAGAAVGLLIWSVLHVEELAPPEVTLTFFNAPPPPPPPPPPPAGGAQKKPSTKPKIVPVKTALVQPKVQPKEEDNKPEPDHGGEPGGVPGGVVGGVAGGVVGGVVGGTPTAAPPPPPPAPVAPKMVPSFVFDKERLSAPDPHLPEDFTNRHPKQQFSGTYRICVGTDGRVTEASVVHGIGGIDDIITGQIRRGWVYKPQPLPICSVRVFVFKIN